MLTLALACGLVLSLAGCGGDGSTKVGAGGGDDSSPPLVVPGSVHVAPVVLGATVQDPCTGTPVELIRPAVEVTWSGYDPEDVCGEAYVFFSTDGGQTYRPATESSYRGPDRATTPCSDLPLTGECLPCLPELPAGESSAGAGVPEPDNHARPVCLGGSSEGQVNRFYWDTFQDGVSLQIAQQAFICVVATDVAHPLPGAIWSRNNEILEAPDEVASSIPLSYFDDLLRDDPSTTNFECSPALTVDAVYSLVGIDDTSLQEIPTGPEGRDVDVPVYLENAAPIGPTCFHVGIELDPTHLSFSYFAGDEFAGGTPPLSADLIQPTSYLVSVGGTATLVAPEPSSMTGTESFFVVQVQAPTPLPAIPLFELLLRAAPPPAAGVQISEIELVPVDSVACGGNPASCASRLQAEVPPSEYRGFLNDVAGGSPCSGVPFPMRVLGAVTVTSIEAGQVETGPPHCCLQPPEPLDVRPAGGLALRYFLTDSDADAVSITAEYSTDGGATWAMITELVSDPISEGVAGLASSPPSPCPISPTAQDRPCDIPSCASGGDVWGAAEHTLVWDLAADVPGGLACDLTVRLTPNDGTASGNPCLITVPTFMAGPELLVRRRDDPAYLASTMISTAGGGSPIILPTLPAEDYIQVFARTPAGEIDITEAVTFTSSDPAVIDVTYDAGAGAARVRNDPGSLVPGARPLCEIGNHCVTVDVAFTGFTTPPLDACTLVFFDATTGAALPDLVARFSACTDLGGPDYASSRIPYMDVGDLDAGVPGLPSGNVIPGAGGFVDVPFFVNTGAADLGAYSIDLQWEPVALTYEDVLPGPDLPTNPTVNAAQATATPLATLEWNNFTLAVGLRGLLELETVRFTVVCPTGPCATQFRVNLDSLVDQGGGTIGTFAGGPAEAATDCDAQFTVP